MRLEILSGLGGALSHKSGLMITAILSSFFSVSLPFAQKVWIGSADFGLSGLELAWCGSMVVMFLTIVRLVLVVYEHILTIRQKRRDLIDND